MEKVTTLSSDIPGIIQISDIKLGCVENTRTNYHYIIPCR